MAKQRVGGSTGSLTISGHVMDFSSFSIRYTQPVDSAASYNDVLYESHNGAGLLAVNLDAQGTLAFGSTGPHPEVIAPGGANATVQYASGCTFIGLFILSDMTLGHSRKSGVAPASISAMNAGNITAAWADT